MPLPYCTYCATTPGAFTTAKEDLRTGERIAARSASPSWVGRAVSTLIPPSVRAKDNQRLICSRCNQPIPHCHGRYVNLALSGASGGGKSAFIVAVNWAMMNSGLVGGVSFMPGETVDFRTRRIVNTSQLLSGRYEDALPEVDDADLCTALPRATPPGATEFRAPLTFDVSRGGEPLCTAGLVDNPGEATLNGNIVSQSPTSTQSNGVLLVVNPFAFQGVLQTFTPLERRRIGVARTSRDYLAAASTLLAVIPKHVPVAIVISRGDELEGRALHDAYALGSRAYDAPDTKLRRIIAEEWAEPVLVEHFRKRTTKFFLASSTGAPVETRTVDGEDRKVVCGYSPWGVLQPLLWLLSANKAIG